MHKASIGPPVSRDDKVKLAVQTTVSTSLFAFFKGQLSWLGERGFVVHAVSSGGSRLAEVAQWKHVHTHQVEMERTMHPVKDARALLQLIRLYRREKFTIVHSFSPKAGLLGMVGAWLARCPVKVFSIWGLPGSSNNSNRWRLMRAADKVSSAIAD